MRYLTVDEVIAYHDYEDVGGIAAKLEAWAVSIEELFQDHDS